MSSGMAKFTLLLVDDEPAVIDMLEVILSEEGYVVHTAGSGAAVLILTLSIETLVVYISPISPD
jgi:CheY-like chemotaxis protein